MSDRPVRNTRLPAKFADNDDELVLTSHRRDATTSNLVQVSSSAASKSSTGPGTTNIDVSSSRTSPDPLPPNQASTKRPRAPSELQTVSDDDGATTDTPDDAPKTKKSKKTPSQHVGLQNESSIISIDDTDDIQNERLNKIDATADIKEFFIPLPPLPGQDKGRMQCMLCRYVLFLSGFIFLS